MNSHPSPRIASKLRLKFRTEYEFAVERGLIADGEVVTRDEVRHALLSLSHMEQRELEQRLRRRFQRLYELMDGDRQTFDEPYARTADLPDGVNLSNEMIE